MLVGSGLAERLHHRSSPTPQNDGHCRRRCRHSHHTKRRHVTSWCGRNWRWPGCTLAESAANQRWCCVLSTGKAGMEKVIAVSSSESRSRSRGRKKAGAGKGKDAKEKGKKDSSSSSSSSRTKRRRKDRKRKRKKDESSSSSSSAGHGAGRVAVPVWLPRPQDYGSDFVTGGGSFPRPGMITPAANDVVTGGGLTGGDGRCFDFSQGRCNRPNCRFMH